MTDTSGKAFSSKDNSAMETMIITCIQCDLEFEFSIREQEKFRQRGFDTPLRCSQCRKNKSREPALNDTRKFKDKKKHYRIKYKEQFDY